MAKNKNYKNVNLINRISPAMVDFKRDTKIGVYDDQFVSTVTITKFPVKSQTA